MGVNSKMALVDSEAFANSEMGALVNEMEATEPNSKKYELIGSLMRKEAVLSYSWLKELGKSPRHFLDYKLEDFKQPTESMTFGSIVDLLITEQSEFERKFKVVSNFPTSDNQKNYVSALISGKTEEEAFKAAYKSGSFEKTKESLSEYVYAIKSGKTPITPELKEEAEKVAQYLLSQEKITELLDSCEDFQKQINFEYNGWKFKGFKDASAIGLIIDLKLMSQLNPDYVDREIIKMDYPLQMAVYQLGEPTNIVAECYNIVYDRSANYMLCKYDQSLLAYGRRKLDYLIHKLEKCVEENLWNESYNFHDHQGIKTLYKPNWIKGFEID